MEELLVTLFDPLHLQPVVLGKLVCLPLLESTYVEECVEGNAVSFDLEENSSVEVLIQLAQNETESLLLGTFQLESDLQEVVCGE